MLFFHSVYSFVRKLFSGVLSWFFPKERYCCSTQVHVERTGLVAKGCANSSAAPSDLGSVRCRNAVVLPSSGNKVCSVNSLAVGNTARIAKTVFVGSTLGNTFFSVSTVFARNILLVPKTFGSAAWRTNFASSNAIAPLNNRFRFYIANQIRSILALANQNEFLRSFLLTSKVFPLSSLNLAVRSPLLPQETSSTLENEVEEISSEAFSPVQPSESSQSHQSSMLAHLTEDARFNFYHKYDGQSCLGLSSAYELAVAPQPHDDDSSFLCKKFRFPITKFPNMNGNGLAEKFGFRLDGNQFLPFKLQSWPKLN